MALIEFSEHQHQVAVFNWSKFNYKKYPMLEFMFSTLNGVKLSIGAAKKAKAAGNKKGVPDIVFPYNNGIFPGLYIEMKREKGGVVSEDQERYINFLIDQGYHATVCYGAKEAIGTIENYLKEDITWVGGAD